MTRVEEITERIGARPALIRMQDVSEYFGDAAPYRIEDGVAIIDVSGVLTNDAWSWGGTTYGDIQRDVKIAMADPNVTGILLNINSPGGECDNAFETAAVIASAAALKPTYAVAGTTAASAAYLLASQANKIYLPKISGGVGSIGICMLHMDVSGALTKAGIKATQISAGTDKTAGSRLVPLTDAARELMQAEVDRLYGEFVGAVAKGRGIAPQAIVTMGARMFFGAANAISSGLADASGDLDMAWADLCAEAQKPKTPIIPGFNLNASANSTKGGTMAEQQTVPPVAAAAAAVAPDIDAITKKATDEGFAAAGQIAAVCAIAGKPARAADFIAERKSVAEVSALLMAEKVAEDKKNEIDPSVLLRNQQGKETAELGKPKPWGEVMSDLAGRAFGQKKGGK